MGELANLHSARNFALEIRIREYIRAAHTPELCAYLSPTPPPKGEDYVEIWRFCLSREKRPDKTMAPCPACSPGAPKYFNGVLIWSPNTLLYRFIGIDCAASHVGSAQYEAAKREYREREKSNADYVFTFDNIAKVPVMLRHLECLLASTVKAERHIRVLGRSHLRGRLYEAVRAYGGQLKLWSLEDVEKIDANLVAESAREAMAHEFGMLLGWKALGPHQHARDIRAQIERLKKFDMGVGDQGPEWVLAEGERYRYDLRLFRQEMKRAVNLRAKVFGFIEDVQQFFSPANFENLAIYAHDENNALPFYVEVQGVFFLMGETKSTAFRVRPDFLASEDYPPWPNLDYSASA